MTTRARGAFDVKLVPQPAEPGADPAFSRLILDKQFHGDLEATSKGQMLAMGTSEKTSAGYVAIERVTGTLAGRTGSFALQHYGLMNRGTPTLSVTIIPDSGTDQLAGITGTMTIILEGGKHDYELDYTLAAPPKP